MKPLKFSIGLLVVTGLCFCAAGCGESGGPDTKTEQARVDKATEMRELFNKAGGDYTKLDATDKATFDKLAGGAGEATFNEMKVGPSSVSTGPNQ